MINRCRNCYIFPFTEAVILDPEIDAEYLAQKNADAEFWDALAAAYPDGAAAKDKN